ncbi:2609_t:CDS:1, partial [Racocetra persica]
GSLVTSAKSDIKEIPILVEFNEKIITLAESDKEMIASAKSDEKEI